MSWAQREMAAASFAENLRAGDDYEWGHRAAFAYAPTYNQRVSRLLSDRWGDGLLGEQPGHRQLPALAQLLDEGCRAHFLRVGPEAWVDEMVEIASDLSGLDIEGWIVTGLETVYSRSATATASPRS